MQKTVKQIKLLKHDQDFQTQLKPLEFKFTELLHCSWSIQCDGLSALL